MDRAFVACRVRTSAGDKYLVVRGVGGWMLPGGYIDSSDRGDAGAAALRELREEAGTLVRLSRSDIERVHSSRKAALYTTKRTTAASGRRQERIRQFGERRTKNETSDYGFVDVSQTPFTVTAFSGQPKPNGTAFRRGTVTHLAALSPDPIDAWMREGAPVVGRRRATVLAQAFEDRGFNLYVKWDPALSPRQRKDALEELRRASDPGIFHHKEEAFRAANNNPEVWMVPETVQSIRRLLERHSSRRASASTTTSIVL